MTKTLRNNRTALRRTFRALSETHGFRFTFTPAGCQLRGRPTPIRRAVLAMPLDIGIYPAPGGGQQFDGFHWIAGLTASGVLSVHATED